ncbi:MAG TPA: CRTAC1 family protein, partial [Vicinamibacterales bacterium]|nr:CRTAC1 family protein [Vicinamibacterales bacterium]
KARPGNLAVTLERARLAAKRGDAAALDDCLRLLDAQASGFTEPAAQQFSGLKTAAAAKNYAEAARYVAFLRNVLVRVPVFRESLAAVRTPTELIADPFETFIALPSPSSNPSPVDDGLTFTRAEPVSPNRPQGAEADATQVDWNRDFKMDYAICEPKQGVGIFIQQDDGTYRNATPKSDPLTAGCFKVWAADIEMDGDVDLIAGVRSAAPVVLRNNGDGSWKQLKPFAGVTGVRAFAWGDVDGDGDPDAVLVGERGDVHVFENRQAGEFREMPAPPSSGAVLAVALGDVNADGRLDIVSLDTNGVLRRTAWGGGRWSSEPIGQWPSEIPADAVGAYRIFVEDMDNNGALDVIASGGGKTGVWLADSAGRPFQERPLIELDTLAVVDTNNDGTLDLVGDGVRFVGKGTKGYHWQVLRPRAQPIAGDQRINSFGVGGEIEIRSGRLTEKQIIGSRPVHFGLGTRTAIDVARIFWPNGIMQADFDRKADQELVAEQRLKGSCPWVFTWDGTSMRFVTDFLWRSPLGLRINAVDTAGVTQTGDWVKIRGDQLVARDGKYDVRITAELWETHFIDHVSLLVVDHPAGTEVYVDERFAREAPPLAVHTLTRPQPVAHAWDDSGRDVTDVVSKQDGRYLSTFARGEYQGIAKDHFVEVDLGGVERPFQGRGRWLVANGWIYPTDSSINVAIGQQHIQPHGIALEAQDERGQWTVVAPDLGFPAGKNKTILIDLSRIGRARRIRLRTNLEIYWDSLGLADDASD